ncbi:MAG: hypothetical protein ABH824_05545 [Nanoarchaeota archaeon]|nr:hypothetical protein [Nanoarchaeota archaeon]MBU1631729.1 hypothetical protein [Nanoarchaeota archaeon]MBU1875872.1 hypothetical protein [Nanoarchaeota archaeon]
MSLKKEVLGKVPVLLQEEPHFHALLDHIKHHNIENKEHLRDFLEKEIAIVEKWLEENKKSGVTTVKSVRDKVLHLDVLKKCFKITQEFIL